MAKSIKNKSAVAKRLGISRSTLYALLGGEKTGSVELAQRLARELWGTPQDWYRRPRPRGRPFARRRPDVLTPMQELDWKRIGSYRWQHMDEHSAKVARSGIQFYTSVYGRQRIYKTVRRACAAVEKHLAQLALRKDRPCRVCRALFVPTRADHVLCSTTCRSRRHRWRKRSAKRI